MEPFILKNKEYFVIKEWTKKFPQLIVGFTTKNGGISEKHFAGLNLGLHVNDQYESVSQNRKLLADLLNFPLDCWVGAEQTHEVHIQKVFKENAGSGSVIYEESFKGTDGFYSFDKGILLTMCYADCVPLYFFHENTGAIGVAHAGWKGSVNGIGKEMVQHFKSEGIDEKQIKVAIGPSICKKCYIVDDYVISLVKKIVDDNEIKPYNLIKDGQYHLDLKGLNKEILLKAGVLDRNIVITNHCTSCHHGQFFSHRRDKGKAGRMMSFIGWKEESIN